MQADYVIISTAVGDCPRLSFTAKPRKKAQVPQARLASLTESDTMG